jgi:poly(3-hydroxybutyrate) depolymerase
MIADESADRLRGRPRASVQHRPRVPLHEWRAIRAGCRAVAVALGILLGQSVPASAAGDLTYVVHEPSIRQLHPPLIVLLHGSGAD